MINFTKESLLCHIVASDALAAHLGIVEPRAYLRAWILRNRDTGEVHALYRFSQLDGKTWYEIKDPDPEKLRVSLEKVFTVMCRAVAPEIAEPVTCFYPPAEATPEETIEFLLRHDLITLAAVEIPPVESTKADT